MDASFTPKRPLDTATSDPNLPAKHLHLPPPPTAAAETQFRILCPASKTSALIGNDGSILRQIHELTGSKIHILDPLPSSDERVILIVADSSISRTPRKNLDDPNHSSTINLDNDEPNASNSDSNSSNLNLNLSSADKCEEGSPAQQALVRVFERMVRFDEEKENNKSNGDGIGEIKESVVCRLLAASYQAARVLGRGGKVVEKIRHESGAQIRVFPKDQIPACASPGDELIQITGNFSDVKKAILSVSSCFEDNPQADAANSAAAKPSGMVLHGSGMPAQVEPFPQRGYASNLHPMDVHLRGYSSMPGSEKNIGANHRVLEEEVVFKVLCQQDKVGSLIGKGGSIVRTLQNETGASIKVADGAPDTDERVVVISARENSEQKYSPAQDAVIRVHCRIVEIGFEPGAAVCAKLLVHPHQIGCLLGRGGFIVSEMRRITGASIRIFPKEQVPTFGSQNDELVQVIGSLHSVQDALFHITSRLRETIFPMKRSHPNISGPPYFSPFPDIPPQFRQIHNPASPGHYPSPVGLRHGTTRGAVSSQPADYQPTFSHGPDYINHSNFDRVPYPRAAERPGHGPTFDRPSSPRSWTPQQVSSGNQRGNTDVNPGMALMNGPLRSGSQAPILMNTNVEVVIPRALLNHVYGENSTNLIQIRQVSGAKVVVHDPEPEATEGRVVVSGAPDQMHAAQSLIHAFILCGQTTF